MDKKTVAGLLEELGVLHGLLLLPEAESKDHRVLLGLGGPVEPRALAREALVPRGRLLVDGDGLVVSAYLVDRLLREVGLVHHVVGLDENQPRLDGLRDEARGLEDVVGAGALGEVPLVAEDLGLITDKDRNIALAAQYQTGFARAGKGVPFGVVGQALLQLAMLYVPAADQKIEIMLG